MSNPEENLYKSKEDCMRMGEVKVEFELQDS